MTSRFLCLPAKFENVSKLSQDSKVILSKTANEMKKNFPNFVWGLPISSARLRLGFAQLSRILPTPLVFRWGYVNAEKVLYCLNRKNNFKEVLDSLNGGNWKVPGEEITLSLKLVEAQYEAKRKGH